MAHEGVVLSIHLIFSTGVTRSVAKRIVFAHIGVRVRHIMQIITFDTYNLGLTLRYSALPVNLSES